MIQINKLPEYHNELIIEGKDYNGETPQDELQYHIESNISFVEDEESQLEALIASEPTQIN
ncbi:hypothetical protein [Methanobrevibacter sp.]|jgi:hypothetical protein|uniref:hypothetical protein n=1 Tax=Methanobrevibacter sp. TaxID=66852 RepID=UPI003869DB75